MGRSFRIVRPLSAHSPSAALGRGMATEVHILERSYHANRRGERVLGEEPGSRAYPKAIGLGQGSLGRTRSALSPWNRRSALAAGAQRRSVRPTVVDTDSRGRLIWIASECPGRSRSIGESSGAVDSIHLGAAGQQSERPMRCGTRDARRRCAPVP